MSRRDHHSRPVEAVKRPEAAEARRLRAAELLAQGRSPAEVAEAVGVSRESVRRWQALLAQGGVAALRRRPAGGRPPKLSDAQADQVEQALGQGAVANGFTSDLWTLDRVAQVIQRVTGVRLARASVWRLLVGRLGWSLQRPERQARERDEEAIARWVASEWPRIKKGRARNRPG
jgi:transposase